MQISISKKQYMAILLNIKANIYKENREQLKKDLLTMRRLLTLLDQPTEKMATVEKVLAKRLATGR